MNKRFCMDWPFGVESDRDLDRAVGQMRGVFPPELVERVRARLDALDVGEAFEGLTVSPNLPSSWRRVR